MTKIRTILMVVWCLLFAFVQAQAQAQTVNGKVTGDDGEPLPGAAVQIKGTSTGTVTDAGGKFRLQLPAGAKSLVISFVGLITQEVEIGNRTEFNVKLLADEKLLSEVVVTAVGIERDTRKLGYSIQEVNRAAISQQSTPDVAQALQGKFAGVQILQGSGSPGAAASVVIRGNKSVNGSNQALVVLDGIPIDNSSTGSETNLFGSTSGGRLSDVNPEDIESVTVLKGPAASAVYGALGVNGAVVITTKSGKKLAKESRSEVTLSSSMDFSQVMGMPKLQNSFGQGGNGFLADPQVTTSWGGRFRDGEAQTIVDRFGNTVPFQAYPNNVKDFFQIGKISQTNLGVRGGNPNTNYAVNVGYTDQQGTVPLSQLKRISLKGQVNTKLSNKFSFGANFNYIKTDQSDGPQGNTLSSVYFALPFLPRSYDPSNFEDAQGNSQFYAASTDNPYWTNRYNRYNSTVNRSISNFDLTYQPVDWIKLVYRVGVDSWRDERLQVHKIGARRFPNGQVLRDNLGFTRFIHNMLATVNRKITADLEATLIAGFDVRDDKYTSSTIIGDGLAVPDFYGVGNAATPRVDQSDSRERFAGAFGDLQLAYKDFLFLGVTGRNDWSSTFAPGQNSYFYPSVNTSFIFTEAFGALKDNQIFSFGKLRASWGQLGNAASPYLLNTLYIQGDYGNNTSFSRFPFNGINGYNLSTTAGNANLRPEIQSEWEVGADLRFFNNRLGIDASYYNRQVIDQIFFFASIAPSSGFQNERANAGKISTRGLELVLTGTPVVVGDFKWEMQANYTKYKNVVNELPPGVERFQLGTDRFGGIGAFVVPGRDYGVLLAAAVPRDPETGKMLINPLTGLPFAANVPNTVVGNPNPDYVINLTNSLTYKGLRLSFQFDFRQGGDLISATARRAIGNGATEETAVDRDRPRIIDGILATDVTGRQSSGLPNNIQVASQQYWAAFGTGFNEFAVFSGTNLRLRQVSLAYNMPTTWFAKTPIKALTLSVSGRNLWFFAPFLRHIDPDASTTGPSNGNGLGLEFQSAPSTRNFGINLNATF